MPAGRPPEYNEETLKKAQVYLDSCNDHSLNIGTPEKPNMVHNVKIPTKGGLAKYLGINRDTIYDWSSKYPEFSDIIEALGSEQEDRLINNSLAGTYNPTIAKVLLTKHGYNDKTETDITTKGDKINTGNISDIEEIARRVGEELKAKKLNQ